MSINRAEMQTVWTVLTAILAFFVLQILQSPLTKAIDSIGPANMMMLLELLSFALCFAILTLGWMIFVPTMCRLRLSTAALFAAIGVIDLLCGLSLPGMPFHDGASGDAPQMLLAWFSQGLAAVGLPILFAMRNASVPPRSRIVAIVAVAGLLGVLTWWVYRPGAFDLADLEAIRPFQQLAVMALYALTAVMILYRHRRERPQAMLTIVQGLVWLFFAMLESFAGFGSAHEIFAAGFKLAGYYCLLKGIYYVSIEEPLKRSKEFEARIYYQAYHDELTGLPNRSMFAEKVEAEMNRASRSQGRFAMLWLDLDRFKTINDSLGHAVGDQLLLAVADRLAAMTPGQECLFRMGGDEFAILLSQTDAEQAEQVAQRLVDLFEEPVRIGPSAFHLSVSIGIALYPEDGHNLIMLQQNADTAMYSAKETRNGWKRYLNDMNRKAKERLLLENDLRIALELGQFRLAYQPLVDLDTCRLTAAEALLRWHHPQKGEIPPSEFIPLCEENGFILSLGEWVLRHACEQMKQWQDKGYPPIIVAVNLSIRQFRQHDLSERIRQALDETGLAPHLLELEITESIMADVQYATEMLEKLKAIGVRISIDDFGTGYSSLHYLKRFPIDKLKIDRSFVSDVLTDRSDAAIVSGISAMARNLNLKVTAEGVESEGQVRFLKEQRCQEAQGYFFSKPVGPGQFEELLAKSMRE